MLRAWPLCAAEGQIGPGPPFFLDLQILSAHHYYDSFTSVRLLARLLLFERRRQTENSSYHIAYQRAWTSTMYRSLSLSLSPHALITRWESAYTRRHNRKEEDIKFYTEWQSNPRPLHVTDIWHALDHEVWLEKCGIISQYYKKKIKPRDIPIR